MSKKQFLKKLEKSLHQINNDDREKIITFYDEYIQDAVIMGKTEDEIISSLNIDEIVKENVKPEEIKVIKNYSLIWLIYTILFSTVVLNIIIHFKSFQSIFIFMINIMILIICNIVAWTLYYTQKQSVDTKRIKIFITSVIVNLIFFIPHFISEGEYISFVIIPITITVVLLMWLLQTKSFKMLLPFALILNLFLLITENKILIIILTLVFLAYIVWLFMNTLSKTKVNKWLDIVLRIAIFTFIHIIAHLLQFHIVVFSYYNTYTTLVFFYILAIIIITNLVMPLILSLFSIISKKENSNYYVMMYFLIFIVMFFIYIITPITTQVLLDTIGYGANFNYHIHDHRLYYLRGGNIFLLLLTLFFTFKQFPNKYIIITFITTILLSIAILLSLLILILITF